MIDISFNEAMGNRPAVRRLWRRIAPFAIFIFALVWTKAAEAQTTYTWNDSTTSWTTATAWTPNGPASWFSDSEVSQNLVLFPSQATIVNQPVIDNNVQVLGITIDDSQAEWNISRTFGALNIGANGLTVTSSGTKTSTLSANVTVSGDQTWTNPEATTINMSGLLSGSSSLTKAGSGNLVLSNNSNNFSGAITISGGTLSVTSIGNGGAPSALGASSAAASNLNFDGGTLNYTGAGDSTDRLFTVSPNGATITSGGTGALKFTSTVGLTYSGSGARTLTLGGSGAGANVLAASITDGPGGATSIVKTGTGTWLLSGTASYTGVTRVSGGILVVSGDRSAATGPLVGAGGGIAVADGTKIGGDIILRPDETGFQASQAGTAATQTNSPQFFGDSEEATVMGSMTMEEGAIVEFEVQGRDPETGYDQVEVDKDVIINGACLDLVVDGYTPTVGELFFIINNKGNDPITGQFTNAPDGSIITADGQSFMVTYSADFDTDSATGGNDLALIAVPEPATICLALSAAVLLAGHFSRRKSVC